MYGNGWGTKKNSKEAFYWASRGAQKNDPASQNVIGVLYWRGEDGLKPDVSEATLWFERAANQNYDLAINNLIESKYDLAQGHLFSKHNIKQDKQKGYALLKELHASKYPFLAYELESEIYSSGLDRPVNRQKSVLYALKAMELELNLRSNSVRRDGTYSGRAILNKDFLDDLDVPKIYDLAFYRHVLGEDEVKSAETYKNYVRQYSPEIVKKSQDLDINEVLKHTLSHVKNRQLNIGPVEASDLINEGWAQFTGKRGKVNEPLAQLLTEEGLRLAIRTKSKIHSDYAKNNLGVILNDAANLNVRNSRLAQIHLFDGRDSRFGPSNLLWDNYIGVISLPEKEKNVLKERYFKQNNNEHISFTLPKLPDDVKGSKTRIIEFLIQNYKVSNKDLAKNIAYLYESTATTKQDYEKSLNWFKLAQNNERAERIQRIINGDYEKEMPNFTGTVNQLFEVDLVETRGALLTSLSSALTPLRNTPLNLEKSKRKLNLHAIVIGNSAYKVKPLKNSTNDAKAIANKFRSFGFDVTEVIDADRKKFRETLVNFSERSKNSDVTVFYYAGHGMQLGGINYLLPTDIDFSMPESVVTYDGLSLNDIKNRSLPGSTKLIFLDACRNNPFESTARGNQSGGLAPVNVGTGTLISFATRDGSVALDSVGGQHSPYTQALLKYLDTNEDVELMLRTVGDEVLRLTKNRQEPWKYGALSGQKVILPMLAK
jgi:TPR repeat protein